MRNYIRHPVSIPIHVRSEEHGAVDVDVQNLSVGGLCFLTKTAINVGDVVEFKIPIVRPDYEGRGVVVWLKKKKAKKIEVGMRFISDDEFFRTRMVEQVCRIEEYRQRLVEKGRSLTSEEAALEWIDRYAKDFGREEE